MGKLAPENFIMMPIPADRYTDVCALLGGAAMIAVASAGAGAGSGSGNAAGASAPQGTGAASEPSSNGADGAQSSTSTTATSSASPSDDASGEIDAHGWPWSADLHASTKGKTKDGLWRMKVGVSRPDPKPGFPVENGSGTGTSSTADAGTNSATSQGATDQGNGQPSTAPATGDEEDEFAAFRAAADASNATDAAAAASVPARQFSDADLGALCNQAAVKLGDPAPIKEIISKYVPEGQVAHSRNIPAEQRDNFAKEVEAKAGISFAG